MLEPNTSGPGRLRAERGQALVEYALILALVAVVSITVLTTVGSNASSVFARISASIVDLVP